METQEKLIGFDVREMWLGMSDWTQSRRDYNLIKHDIDKPLSADTMVWQSVFDLNPSPTLPSFRGPVQFLWENFGQMRQHFYSISIAKPSWTIAVTINFDLLTIDEQRDWQTLDLPVFNATDYSAKFLGYDVADRFLQSGLTNTVVDESDRTSMAQNWGEHLSKYHLLTDYDLADSFKHFINPLVPGHAPFFVYGLYLIASS